VKVLNDFQCDLGHKYEYFVDNTATEVECQICSKRATKCRSVPNFQLPGNDKAGFPTAHAAWEKKREQKMRQEAKQDS
jgi:hypothetical protein